MYIFFFHSIPFHSFPPFPNRVLVITHHNFQATIMLIASNTSPDESQLIQLAMSLYLYDIVQLPPPDISNQIDVEIVVVSPTCTNDA